MWIVAVAVTVVLAINAAPARAGVNGCPDCNTKVILGQNQADCIKKRMESLIQRPPDPVFFDASDCGQTIDTMTAADPSIVSPPPAKTPDALWLELMKRQLACLKQKLDKLPPNQSNPIEIDLDDAECPAAKP